MPINVPVCKRCCFCLPLRYGLIVWGYLRLCISSLLLIGASILWDSVVEFDDDNNEFSKRDRLILGLSTVVIIADIIFSLVFIVGSHKKNVKLMKIFYFYGIFLLTLTAALTVYEVFCWIILIIVVINYIIEINVAENKNWMYIIDIILYLTHFILKLYVLLLVPIGIIKLDNNCQIKFVNHVDEAQGPTTLNKNKTFEGVEEAYEEARATVAIELQDLS